MKTKTYFLAVIFIMFIGNVLSAQKPKNISGDFSKLKGQTEVTLFFDYTNVKVGKMTEEAYIEKKMAAVEKKVPGDGPRWLAAWQTDKTNKYHPQFLQYLNYYLIKTQMKADTGMTSGKYALVVKIIMIEPGFATGTIGSKESQLTAEVKLIEISNPDNILAGLLLDKIKNNHYNKFLGSSADFDAGTRISGAYGTAAEVLGKYLKKILK
ncbi:MAG: hypothetical protein NTX61_15670 [Bacteroidetes bacterium]|nr:hypothetical protein [Bacteroidota bacterium]